MNRFQVAAACALTGFSANAFADPTCSVGGPGITCLMTALDNPRGLAFGQHGALFVAEAGRGGAVTGPCVGVGGFNCYGHTGSVSRYQDGLQDRVVTGLPSISFPQGASARGPHDIVARSPRKLKDSVLGEGGALVTIGLEKDPAVRAVPGREDFAKLVHIPATTLYAARGELCTHACWQPVVDLGAVPVEPKMSAETDPYGLIEEPEGVTLTDASRNWLVHVAEDGSVERLASLPSRFDGRITDSVPTAVARGPDGAYYVGELVGVPFSGPTRPPSNIYRVEGEAPHDVSVFLTGMNAIIDLAFHGDSLYVLQHWTTNSTGADGRLLKFTCNGRPLQCDVPPEVVIANLDRATAILVERGGIYMSLRGANAAFQNGVYTPLGEVIRIEVTDDAQTP